ncbi:MAG: response regulator [Bacilli bacterium]|nr:response regulator [Bacilli bacterium]
MKSSKTRKRSIIFIIAINIFFVAGLSFGEWTQIQSSNARTIAANKESFLNTNISLSSMTSNYILGESHLCRSWSNHLTHEVSTIDEAIDFVTHSITDVEIMSHILYKDSLTGLSTSPNSTDSTDFTVDYNSLGSQLFSSRSENIKVTPRYTNPINGASSIAFYYSIPLVDPLDSTKTVPAYLLRVVPTSNLSKKWTFPSGAFEHLEVAIIDDTGSYVISQSSFVDSNFFNFYTSYNSVSDSELDALKTKVLSESGSMAMNDSKGVQRYVSYSQISNGEQWTVITSIPMSDINYVQIDWLTISIIAVGLGVLFAIDLVIFLIQSKKLQEAAKLAESANKAKTDFLSTMSHDIRTPMNAIVGLTTIARKEENNPESTSDALKKIELASNHLLTLINDILDISKVESGKLTLNPLDFLIADMFENLVNISQPMIRAKNINFSFRVHNFENEWLYADKLRLSQIFTNLLSNALKYTEENGDVSVDIKEEKSEKEGCIKLIYQVTDTGIGMSQEFLKHMYQPFSRATDSRVNSIQGTGLGLAITKRMVDLMGGDIECESELGKGTTFIVSLDILIGKKPSEEMILPPTDILIVDDDEILLQTAEQTLISLGATTSVAKNGKDALELIKNNHFDIIILDWKMPDMNGIEVVKRIRESKDKDIPIILISSYDWSEIEKDAHEIGINGFIFKPLFRSKIYQKIIDLTTGEKKVIDTAEDFNFPGTNVLIVEDNDINWEIISTLLSMHGITSERAENGKVAYELISDKSNIDRYDLIFMDIQMPVMNGLEATRLIRKLDFEYAKNIPIIAMTADAFSENIAECKKAGMNGHIAKPIDLNIVLSEIKKIKEKL